MASIREKLAQGTQLIGSWAALGNTLSAELMGRVGFDFLIVDTQHGGLSEAGLLPILQVISGTGTPALVRVNWLDEALIMRVADCGAAGVVVPMVNTPEDAARAVRAIRYPPHGIRSFGPVRSGYSIDGKSEDPLCLVMIETAQALSNLDAIADTPGLDGLLVGPVDLALSLGLGLSLDMSDTVLDAIERISAACKARGLVSASVCFNPANAAQQLRRGVGMLASGSDTLFLRRAAGEELEALRRAGEGPQA